MGSCLHRCRPGLLGASIAWTSLRDAQGSPPLHSLRQCPRPCPQSLHSSVRPCPRPAPPCSQQCLGLAQRPCICHQGPQGFSRPAIPDANLLDPGPWRRHSESGPPASGLPPRWKPGPPQGPAPLRLSHPAEQGHRGPGSLPGRLAAGEGGALGCPAHWEEWAWEGGSPANTPPLSDSPGPEAQTRVPTCGLCLVSSAMQASGSHEEGPQAPES